MWPYSKIKHTQPELKQAECPVCTGPSTAEHYEDGTIITNTCPICQNGKNIKSGCLEMVPHSD